MFCMSELVIRDEKLQETKMKIIQTKGKESYKLLYMIS